MKYLKTEIARTHRLTEAMVWCLLEVGKVRPATVRALVTRGLVNLDPAGGWWISEQGVRVRDALVREVRQEDGTDEGDGQGEETEDGHLYAECEDAGGHVEVAPIGDCASSAGYARRESDHESQDCGWPPSLPDGPPEEAPSLVRADEIHAGDVLVWAGKRRTVLGTWTDQNDIVLSTHGGTLTMPPGTPVRAEQAVQLALSTPVDTLTSTATAGAKLTLVS